MLEFLAQFNFTLGPLLNQAFFRRFRNGPRKLLGQEVIARIAVRLADFIAHDAKTGHIVI